ncbi:drug resistance transporter, EmrB/QacA subfamily [Paenibacillus sophorae]|uniref:Drug resistance transporter, EmrB/QacA subfamily n=2 Tax=Paenibacillus sophorae TaxID=1333845 RepID=A0A1H8W5Z3_9BACL|nr:MFS transporter [Paenibacillus sophorae]QWU13265.1 MFS transporter [Paenibacillus sophorae]SEP22558.1 drug resistance transporter, EmrB/QacA subfamily [Paenibacillus sophorae]
MEEINQKTNRLILIAISLANFIVMMDYTIINVALQTIQVNFNASNAELQWMVSSYEILYASLLLPAGFLSDRYGRKKVMMLGLIVFILSSGLIAFSESTMQIIVARGLMGLGGAVVPSTTLAIIKETYKKYDQAKAIGVWSAFGGSSIAIGPIIAGFLLQMYPWYSVFTINLPIGLICLIIIMKLVPNTSDKHKNKLDLIGMILSVLGVSLILYGIIKSGELNKIFTINTGGAIIIGIIIVLFLLKYEYKINNPMLELSLLCDRIFTSGTISISLSYFTISGGTYLFVFFIQLVKKSTPFELGLMMLPFAIGSIIGSLFSERMLNLKGAKFTIIMSCFLLLLGFIGFYISDGTTDNFLIEAFFLLIGLGMGIAMGGTTFFTMSEIPQNKYGSGAGLSNTIRGVTSIMGVGVLGTIYSISYQKSINLVLSESNVELDKFSRESYSQTINFFKNGNFNPELVDQILKRGEDIFLYSFHKGLFVGIIIILINIILGLIFIPRRVESRQIEKSTGKTIC